MKKAHYVKSMSNREKPVIQGKNDRNPGIDSARKIPLYISTDNCPQDNGHVFRSYFAPSGFGCGLVPRREYLPHGVRNMRYGVAGQH